MKLFGLELTLRKRALPVLSGVYTPTTWTNIFSTISEPFTGAWQQNVRLDVPTLLNSSAVYSCVTGIASDIGKLAVRLTENHGGIWDEEPPSNPRTAVLRKPNHYQTTQRFIEQWMLSKLLSGNTYVLKERDQRGIVTSLYILDPTRVTPLIAQNGDLYYEIKQDYLSHVEEETIVAPGSEIIHDMMPGTANILVGTSPLYACMVSTGQLNAIQLSASSFFQNRALPGGMLTAPGRITDETALRMKTAFEEKFGGANSGRLFVAGDGLKFEPLTMTAEQSLLVEQLKWAVDDVARAFHYPSFKLGGPLPPYSGNMQALLLSYYTDCLQVHIEAIEGLLDEGLDVPSNQQHEMDTDNLLRMDTMGMAEVYTKLVGGGIADPNVARKKFNWHPVAGGDQPYLQQQNYSLEALAKRDAQPDPFKTASTTPTAQLQPTIHEAEITDDEIKAAKKRFRERAFPPRQLVV